jgi:hypothetical protein
MEDEYNYLLVMLILVQLFFKRKYFIEIGTNCSS